MFGWEYPPHISGGLGTACYGITKSLTSLNDIQISFVVPRIFNDEDKNTIKLIAASDIKLPGKMLHKAQKPGKHEYPELYPQVSAYITPEHYKIVLKENDYRAKKLTGDIPGSKINFTGRYGESLYDEIYKYGLVASEIAKQEEHNIIHMHDWLTFTAGMEAKRISGKPLIAHIHATEFDRCGEQSNRKVLDIEKKGMEVAEKVITVSNFTRNIVIKRYGIHPDKVVTVYNAVEPFNINRLKIYNKYRNDKIVTFLGRITSQKGPEYFINAANKVLQKTSNVRFVMAGEGDLKEKLIKYVARLGISDRFHFTGFLKGDDVYRMYSMSDLYVMPSMSEPFGISPLEALQSGVPVIISRQSGVSEVLKHVIKINFWDIDGLANAIYGALYYEGVTKTMADKGMKEVMNLKWKDTAIKIRDIYYSILRNVS
jgi:glycosyltransferase involved in cell wall biosynthesis